MRSGKFFKFAGTFRGNGWFEFKIKYLKNNEVSFTGK
jgi:hypothetical protein